MNLCRSFVLFLLVFLPFPEGFGQEPLSRSDIREPVLNLLQEYRLRISSLKSEGRQDPIKEFTALFANPYVKVINNLSENPANQEVAVRAYAESVQTLYPEGVTVSYNPSAVRFRDIDQEFGNQYALTIRFVLTLNAFPGGVVYENKQLVEMRITFNWDGSTASAFQIARIGFPQYRTHEIRFTSGGGTSRISAPWMLQNERVRRKPLMSADVSVNYSYRIDPGFALGVGVGWSYLANELFIDEFNSFSGRNPNLSDIQMTTSMYHFSLPLFASFSGRLSERTDWYADAGVRLDYRYWGDFVTFGKQTNLNRTIRNVVSYPEWESDLHSFSVSALLETGVSVVIGKNISWTTALYFTQGITPIDRNSDAAFELFKYSGQYNPLWMDPLSRNFQQYVGIKLGVAYRFETKDQ